jgi:hypothetical protein
MAVETNTFFKYDAVGVREQLSDIIANISPRETPFMSNAKRGDLHDTYWSWQKDALASAVTTNQVLQGDNIGTHTPVVATVRTGNYTEIARKDYSIAGTTVAVKSAGGANTPGYIAAKLGAEIKRDMESSLLANKGAVAASTGVIPKTAGLAVFLRTNYDKDAGATIPDAYTTAPTDTWDLGGGTRAFTETITKNVLLQCYNSGADVSTIMVGAFNKQAFSTFSGVVELMKQSGAGQATIIGAANVYVSDFGNLTVVPNRFQPASFAYFLDWSKARIMTLRPYKVEELAKNGDNKRFMMTTEYGLQIDTDAAFGIATNLTTS